MTYHIEIHQKCKDEISKLCNKNPVLREALEKKINAILDCPQNYKPLKYELAGERRVHVMKSFVLRFEIDEQRKTVILLFFGHHNKAYKR